MKKIIALPLVAALALGVAACNKSAEQNTQNAEVSADLNAAATDAIADVNAAADNALDNAAGALDNAPAAETNASNAQ